MTSPRRKQFRTRTGPEMVFRRIAFPHVTATGAQARSTRRLSCHWRTAGLVKSCDQVFPFRRTLHRRPGNSHTRVRPLHYAMHILHGQDPRIIRLVRASVKPRRCFRILGTLTAQRPDTNAHPPPHVQANRVPSLTRVENASQRRKHLKPRNLYITSGTLSCVISNLHGGREPGRHLPGKHQESQIAYPNFDRCAVIAAC